MLHKSAVYSLKKIKNTEFIIHHHLGLGDHIICAGLVNYLSNNYERIHIPVKRRNLENVNFLFRNNSKITTFVVDIEEDDILLYSKKRKLQILKIGFKKRVNPFNSGFYRQLNLSYDISFKNFSYLRDIKREENLFRHLLSEYNIQDKYNLVHAESSIGKANLKIKNNTPNVFVKKDTDIYNNIFLYTKLIREAIEIHCIDSSFIHLVERTETNAELFFHNLKNNKTIGTNLELRKNWQIIEYF